MNKKATGLRTVGRVTPEQLYAIELTQHACAYCGVTLTIGQGTFDHRVAYDRGGRNDIRNIVRACISCNRRKFTKTFEELVTYESLRVSCLVCGRVFQPRWAEYQQGRARLCSRSCNARWRWHEKSRLDSA